MRLLLLINFLLVPTSFAAVRPHETSFKFSKAPLRGLYTFAIDDSHKTSSLGLLVFFHGSGATESYAENFKSLQQLADEFKLVPLAIQAPNHNVTWAGSLGQPSMQHPAYVQELIEREIFAKYPHINRNRIFLLGLSAGSTFISGDLLPVWIAKIQGGAVMLCGGSTPLRLTSEALTPLPNEVIKGFRLYYFIQEKNFLYPQTLSGISYWQMRGANVVVNTPAGGSHCAFDFISEARKGLRKIQ